MIRSGYEPSHIMVRSGYMGPHADVSATIRQPYPEHAQQLKYKLPCMQGVSTLFKEHSSVSGTNNDCRKNTFPTN